MLNSSLSLLVPSPADRTPTTRHLLLGPTVNTLSRFECSHQQLVLFNPGSSSYPIFIQGQVFR
jgi:hypothetical protein